MADGTSQPLGRRKFLLGATVAAAGAFAEATQTAAEHSAGESALPYAGMFPPPSSTWRIS